jgi:hypothetical protein
LEEDECLKYNNRIIVGRYINKYNEIIGLLLPEKDIYLCPGLEKHLKKNNHSECLEYIYSISEIILSPDYIGKHPTILQSIEFIKRYEINVLVAVQFDEKDDYYHISNVYDISNGKIEHKLFSGRFRKYI